MRLIDADAFLEINKELADCDFIHPKYCDTLRDLVNNAPTVDVLEQISDEIKDAYDDNRACEQDDVAYGLKVALDIIKEHTKGDN